VSPERPTLVNHPHYFLSPADGIRDCSDRRRYPLPAIVLGQFPSRQNRSHDTDDSFATLVHVPKFTTFAFYSLWQNRIVSLFPFGAGFDIDATREAGRVSRLKLHRVCSHSSL